jgi:hypothetical protein
MLAREHQIHCFLLDLVIVLRVRHHLKPDIHERVPPLEQLLDVGYL